MTEWPVTQGRSVAKYPLPHGPRTSQTMAKRPQWYQRHVKPPSKGVTAGLGFAVPVMPYSPRCIASLGPHASLFTLSCLVIVAPCGHCILYLTLIWPCPPSRDGAEMYSRVETIITIILWYQ